MTYDYNKTSSGQNEYDTESAAPESVSANAAPAAAPENAAAQQPRVNLSGTAPAAHIPAENDPWREPVYKTADDPADVFSPGHHRGGQQLRGTYFPTLDDQKKKPRSSKKQNHGFLKAVCIVLACVLLSSAACAVVTTAIVDHRLNSADGSEPPVVVLGSDPASSVSSADGESTPGDTMTAKEIYALGCQQVVGIKTEVTTTNVFGQATNSAVSGSGFVISEDGYILTNYHVIEYAAKGSALTVMFYGSEQSYDADVIAYDTDNDVAVIKINASGLDPVEFGRDLSVGETVYCIGNPLGELDYTMTSGIVSALDREITTEAGVSINMFQIDAAVNSGNSGGPVYNAYGQVVGVVTAKYSTTGVEGLGFAIPIQDAVNIASDLIQYGYVAGKAYLGINGETVSSSAFQYYNLPYGVYVTNVLEDTCAARAGIKIGDIITAVDDTKITSYSDLKNTLRSHSVGDAIELTVYRSGEYLTLSGTLDERIPAGPDASGSGSSEDAESGENLPGQSVFPWG